MSEKWKIGEIIENRYEISSIKKGGMGIVFLCYDHTSNAPVALKTFHDRYLLDNPSVKRFIEEAVTWIHLDRHPNIVTAYAVETHMFRPYLVLEYIAGEGHYGSDLGGLLKSIRLPLTTVMDFAIQFCNGMIHATDVFYRMGKSFVHCDIKPSNILITRDRLIKISDFGLSRALGEDYLSSGWGTPEYMSPEQFLAMGIVDVRSDIYSFGCVLYEIACSKRPFEANGIGDPAALMAYYKKQHFEQIAIKPAIMRKDCPVALSELIMQCLSKNPSERVPDFIALREKLSAIYTEYTGKKYYGFNCGNDTDLLDRRDLVWKGVSLDSLGRYEEAVACFDKALKMHGSNDLTYNIYCCRASSLAGVRLFERALEDYGNAITINPGLPYAYGMRANIFNNLGRWDDAVADYNRAIELDSQYAIGLYNRGLLYMRTGDDERAIRDFGRAIDLGLNEAYTNRGAIYLRLGRYDEASADFSRALELNPRDAVACTNLGGIFESRGQAEQAVAYYENAMRLNPFYILPYFKRAGLFCSLNRYYEAIADYEQVLSIDPADAASIPGTVYAQTEADLKPIYLITYHDCGIAYMKIGEFFKAKECFQRFMQEAPPMEYSRERQHVQNVLFQMERQY